ncbi:hypothetical protein [Sphingomonas sp. 28-62-11]
MIKSEAAPPTSGAASLISGNGEALFGIVADGIRQAARKLRRSERQLMQTVPSLFDFLRF